MPPKKLKKQPQNPFFFFMMDWKKKQMEMGHGVPGPLNLLAEAATPDWQRLPESDKEYYKSKAEVVKGDDNKFTADGKSFAQVYAEQKKVEDFIAAMRKEIHDTIKSISQDRKSLISQKFYLIHANHYCYWSPKNLYIPCEVAIAEYSIELGVMRTLHFFPTVVATEDGRLPVGYLHEAQDIAKKSHCVPLPPMPDAESYDMISAKLLSFVQQNGTSKVPPLYTMENNLNCNYSMSTVEDFLSHCEEYCGVPFRTYRLDQMFFVLSNACADFSRREGIDPEARGFPTMSIAQMELDRDIFHFTTGISCEYHEEMNAGQAESDTHQVTQFCSLSTVQRWCFLVSDFCCRDVGVKLIRGKHCPVNAAVSYGQSDAPPLAANRWSKGPPKMGAAPKDEPKIGAVVRSAEKAARDAPEGVGGALGGGALGGGALGGGALGGGASKTPATPAPEPASRGDEKAATAAAAPPPQPPQPPQPAQPVPVPPKIDAQVLDNLRLPKTRGRGERLLAAINRIQLDAENDGHPVLGAGRGRGGF